MERIKRELDRKNIEYNIKNQGRTLVFYIKGRQVETHQAMGKFMFEGDKICTYEKPDGVIANIRRLTM